MQTEHNLRVMELLHFIVAVRRTLSFDAFNERFVSPEAAERILRICMVQSIDADTLIKRGRVWHYYSSSSLKQEIPGFDSAWEFYQWHDTHPDAEPRGFFLVPPGGIPGSLAEWVPIQVTS